MRFSATTGGTNPLDADTTYYVKLRFTPNADGSPAGVDNRGFIWNGTSGGWAQERDDWTAFPTVTTDATGAIAQSDWFYCKFGDTTKSGTYYLLVSLSTGASGTTRNGNVVIPVTVFDTTSAGAWVHRGVDNSAEHRQAAKVVDHALPSNPIALRLIEKNGWSTTTAMALSTTSSTVRCRTVASTWLCRSARRSRPRWAATRPRTGRTRTGSL